MIISSIPPIIFLLPLGGIGRLLRQKYLKIRIDYMSIIVY